MDSVIYWRKPSEVNPRGALFVAFVSSQSVSRCKICLKRVNIPYRSPNNFYIVSEYFPLFLKRKIYLFKTLKNNLQTLSILI
jgi:hypothetical protein